MKPRFIELFIIAIVCSCIIPCSAEESHLGGLAKARLLISTYSQREQGLSQVPTFSFPDFAENWDGIFSEGSQSIADNSALATCVNGALGQAYSDCLQECSYPIYETVVTYQNLGGGIGGFGGGSFIVPVFRQQFAGIAYSESCLQERGCGEFSQEQIDQEVQNCSADNQITVDFGSVQKLFSISSGKVYEVNVTNATDVFTAFSFVAPAGYQVSVENENGLFIPRKIVEIAEADSSKTIRFQVQDLRPSGQVTSLGRAAELKISDLKWDLGLGSLKNGSQAGRLMFHESDLIPGLYDRSALHYYYPDASAEGEVEVITDSSGRLRQVRTPQCFADVRDSPGQSHQYEIKIYAPLPFSGSGNVYSVPSGHSLLAKYLIGRHSSDDTNSFFVKTYEGSAAVTSRIETVTRIPKGASTTQGVILNDWTLVRSGTGPNPITKTISVTNTAILGNRARQELSTIIQDANDFSEQNISYQTLRQFIHQADVGEILRIENRDHGFGNYLYQFITYNDLSRPEIHGRTAFTIDPFGGWTFLNYQGKIDDGTGNTVTLTAIGEEGLIIESSDAAYDISNKWNTSFFNDVMAPNTWSVWRRPATQRDYDGVSNRLSGEVIQRFAGEQETLQTVQESVAHASFFDLNDEHLEVVTQYQPYDFPKESNRYRANYMARFTPRGANPLLYGQTYFEFQADGTKTSCGYAETSYRGVNDAFLKLAIDGYHSDSLEYGDTSQNVTLATMTHGQTTHMHESISFEIDEVLLVDGKSKKELTVYNAHGKTRFHETWLYAGGDWIKYKDLENTYDVFGRHLTTTLNGRVTLESHWAGLDKEWEKDEAGLKTIFTRDGLGRVVQEEMTGKAGVSGIPAARITRMYHDAKDREVVTEKLAGANTLTMRKTLDSEGRILSETDSNGLTTDYAYRGLTSGQRVTVTHPNDTIEVRLRKPKGEPLQTTLLASDGATVLSQETHFYSDNVTATDASGNSVVSSANRFIRTDYFKTSQSPDEHPYTLQIVNAAGRVQLEQTASAVDGHPREVSYNYDPVTGQVSTLSHSEVPESDSLQGSPSKEIIFGYDLMGNRVRSGVDVDGGGLAVGGFDRIVDQQRTYVQDAGDWWLEERTTIYPEENAATAVESYTRQKLNVSLATNVIGATENSDYHGNVTETKTTVHRSQNSVTQEIDFPDNSTATSIHINGLERSSSSREGHTTTYEYDVAGRKTKENHPRQFATVLTYELDKERLKTVATGVSGSHPAGYPTTSNYNERGEVDWIENAEGLKTYFTFDGRGSMTHRWGPATQPVWNEYDDFGQLWKVHTYRGTEEDGPDFTQSTWPAGAGDGDLTTHSYSNATGLLENLTDAANRVTSYTYDQLGRLRTRVTPSSTAGSDTSATAAVTTKYVYDSKTDELLNVTYTGDGGLTRPLSFIYHRSGAIKTVTQGSDVRTFHYAFTGGTADTLKLLQEDLPASYTTLSSNAGGGASHLVDAIAYQYQASNSATTVKGRLSGVGLGERSSTPGTLDTSRYSSAYTHDASARINSASIESTAVSYGYLANSNHLETRTRGNLQEKRAYESNRDLLDYIETKSGSTLKVKNNYHYDSMGRRDQLTQGGSHFQAYGGSLFTAYQYNSRSEVEGINVFRASAATSNEALLVGGRSMAWTYDLSGNHRSMTHRRVRVGNGGDLDDRPYTRTSNALNQYSSRQNPDYGEVSGSASPATIVSVGQGTDITRARRDHEYFHAYHEIRDGDTGAVRKNINIYAVDPGAGAGGKDRLEIQAEELTLRPKEEDFKYDARGNLTRDGFYSYTWDAEDRLLALETRASALSPLRLTFAYDYLGRRISKKSYPKIGDHFASSPSKTTLFYWDGWNLLYESQYTHSGSANTFVEAKSYYWGLDWSGSLQGASGVGGLIGMRINEGSWSEIYYPAYDGNGNLLALYTANGASKAEYEYGVYGQLLRSSGELAESNPFRFATKYLDAETSLYQYQHRYYSPDLGRFLSRDPAGEGINLYALVNNGPVNNFDVFGLYAYVPELPTYDWQFLDWLGPERAQEYLDLQWKTWEEDVARTTSYYNDISRTLALASLEAERRAEISFSENLDRWVQYEVNVAQAAQDYWSWEIQNTPWDNGNSSESNYVHNTLDGLGLLPGLGIPMDLTNAAIYAFEGDYLNSSLSLGAAVPIFGYGANAVKGARYADEFADFGGGFGTRQFDNFVASSTGAFNPASRVTGEGLGNLAGREVRLSQRGVDLVENHLSQFGRHEQNVQMVARLRGALQNGQRVSGADASFYLHEAAEATMMRRGVLYDAAHDAALRKYDVSPFSVYHPEVIQSNPGLFNPNWRAFWGIE